MKNFRRLFFIIGLGAFLWSSCTSDIPVREESPAANPESMQVYFPSSQKYNYELPPTVFEVNIEVQREKYSEDATVKIIKVADLADAFTVPETVTFAAGDSLSTLTITFDELEQFKSYQVSFKVEDQYINPYVVNSKGTSDFNLLVQHNDYELVGNGEGQVFDAFAMYSVADVTVMYSESKDAYRISNPYTLDILEEAEWDDWIGGPSSENIQVQITEDGHVTWTFWYLGLTYGAGGTPIKAYFPSYLAESQAGYDDYSGVDADDPNLLILYPYFYMDGLGGWPPAADKVVYISLPGGPDLNVLLEEE